MYAAPANNNTEPDSPKRTSASISLPCITIKRHTAIIDYDLQIEKLFTLFIYAEIIGMVGAYTSSSRIPVTLPIIIAITALCRLIVMHGKDMDALVLMGESGSVLLLSGAAYIMSLKGKLSLEKKKLIESE